MSARNLEQNFSYQEKVHKERIKQVKSLINEYKVLNRKEESVKNKICKLIIKMNGMGVTLKNIHAQLGGERCIPYKTLWGMVDRFNKAQTIKELVGKAKVKEHQPAVARAVEKIKKGATKKEIREIFRAEKKKSPEDVQVVEMVENFRRASFLLNHNLVLKNLDQEQLSNLHELAKECKDGLDKYFGVNKKGTRVQRTRTSKEKKAQLKLA